MPCRSRVVHKKKAWGHASSSEIEERASGVENHEEASKISLSWLVSITISTPVCPRAGNTSDSRPHLLCINALPQGHIAVEHGLPKSSPQPGIEIKRTVSVHMITLDRAVEAIIFMSVSTLRDIYERSKLRCLLSSFRHLRRDPASYRPSLRISTWKSICISHCP